LLSLRGYLVDTAYIIAVMLVTYRMALRRRMLSQYPWLYESAGLFQWRERATGNGR
jgi:hypothetical protein